MRIMSPRAYKEYKDNLRRQKALKELLESHLNAFPLDPILDNIKPVEPMYDILSSLFYLQHATSSLINNKNKSK